MAYRRPTSSICLLKGVPCDHEYHHSVWYTSRQAQFDDMMSFQHEWFNHLSYQRKGRNSFKIEVPVNSFYSYLDYNYVIFSNASVDIDDYSTITKQMNLFYCFLDTIEYVNDNTIEVFYNIDYIQTYMFDYQLGQCFVEREHSYSDELYENVVPENFEISDYYFDLISTPNTQFTDFNVVIRYVPNTNFIYRWKYQSDNKTIDFQSHTFGYTTDFKNALYSGCKKVSFPIRRYTGETPDYFTATVNIRTCISELTSIQAQIVEMYYVPSQMDIHDTDYDSTTGYTWYLESDYPDSNTFSLERTIDFALPASFKSQTETYSSIKNKKLFSSPYISIYCSNHQGETTEYSLQDFTLFNNNIRFVERAVQYGVPELCIMPAEYKGIGMDYDCRLTIGNFPNSIWDEDTALQYWAQNKEKIMFSLLTNAVLIGVGLSGGSTVKTMSASRIGYGGDSKFIQNAINYAQKSDETFDVATKSNMSRYQTMRGSTGMISEIGELISVSNTPDQGKGTQSYSQMPILLNKFGFTLYYKAIKPYLAKQIDDYFSMFGYAEKRIKTPNLFTANGTNRPEWYYIKNAYTKIDPHFTLSPQPIIDGYVNEEVESRLKEIYNNGITFWFNSSHVGNYSRDNSPINT